MQHNAISLGEALGPEKYGCVRPDYQTRPLTPRPDFWKEEFGHIVLLRCGVVFIIVGGYGYDILRVALQFPRV